MGLNAGDKVALVSHNNRCEWNIMDHAIMSVGAINCPLYPTMTEADYEYILNHSESRYCAVSNQELYDKVMSIKDKIPSLEHVFMFEHGNGNHWSAIAEAGRCPAGRTRCPHGSGEARRLGDHHLHARHDGYTQGGHAQPQQHHPDRDEEHPRIPKC